MKASKSNFGVRGWLLIIYMALTFFVAALGGSIINVVAAVYEAERGWSQAFLVSLNSIGGWVGVIFIAIVGAIMAKGKVGIMKLALGCGLVVGVAYILLGQTKNLAVFTILYILYQIGYSVWAQLANQSLCNNWFPRKKGVAIGWATMGFPLSASIGLVIFSVIMGAKGASTGYLVFGALAIVIAVVAFILFKDYPEQCGCFPDNDKTMTREQADKDLEEGRKLIEASPWSTKRLLSTKEVWLGFFACGMLGFFGAGSITQVIPRLLAAGYSPDAATSMIAVCALIAVPGSYIIGVLDAKFGTKKAYIISMAIAAVGSVAYAIPNNATIWIGLVIVGIALGGSSNFAMSMTTTYFGRYHFPKVFGVTLTIVQIVSNAGAICIAYTAAAFGYSIAYYGVAVLCVIMIFVIMPVKDNFAKKYEEKFAIEDGKAA